MAKYVILLFCCCSLWSAGQSDLVDSTHQLAIVVVDAKPIPLPSSSVQPILPKGQTLTQTLSNSGSVFIKQYGSGQLATLSVRGGASGHTAILWNDIPINNPFLGQSDLSLFSTWVAKDVQLYRGGNSIIDGDGALAGSIHFNSRPNAINGFQITGRHHLASFSNQGHRFRLDYGNTQFLSSSKFYHFKGKNDFSFTSPFGQPQKQTNGETNHWGISQDFYWTPHTRHRFKAHFWYLNAARKIPPTFWQLQSVANQEDQGYRGTIEWMHLLKNSVLETKIGFVSDDILFQDSLLDIYSDSKYQRWFNQITFHTQWKEDHQLSVNAQWQYIEAITNNFLENVSQQRYSLSGRYRWYFTEDDRWQLGLFLRQSWVSDQKIPITPGLEISWEPNEHNRIFLKGSRHYRIPSLNDLYWLPGGNPDLAPENAWSAEISWSMNRKYWKLQSALYSRRTDNWIQWLPDGAIWTPRNITIVQTNGFELNLRHSTGRGPWFLENQFTYGLTSSKDLATKAQLIYIPFHQLGWNSNLSWKQWKFNIHQRWNSQVFTTPEHNESLPGVYLLDLEFSRLLEFEKGAEIQLGGNLYNVFNRSYQLVAGQPLPGRNWSLFVQYKLSKTPKGK